ncbi:IS110 family transposase [Paraburkholderia sp. MMS20-SJTR3]|uniref:IS110 family transposase n=1 Tax=Paraburkholderia sejongensis TaxID=2886946 RepID=A0ABS8K647_9BURK|nr:IS110 family transposase [Paraburkholderia sp. MMS20-SJTR3]MCC8397626.1 IS110 family transposase [Paraburkholderia sp. MMS20-SJTR3]
MQALHRVRAQFVHQRTALVSQFRCFLLEYGIAIHACIGMFRRDATRILSDDSNDLTPTMRQLLTDLWSDFLRIDERVAALSSQIEASAKHDVVQRLTTIPGIGPLGASALCAAIGNGKQFRSGRDLAAWIGLVPRQHTTGGKPTLPGISIRGNTYLRRLLVLGAQFYLMHLDRSRDRLGQWLDTLESSIHHNKVVIALANKLARVAWVVLTRPGALYEKMDPRF